MGLFRTRPLISASIVLHTASRASVREERGSERGDAGVDRRFLIATGLVAAAYHRAGEVRRPRYAECLVELATAIAGAGDGDLPFALVHLGPLGVREFLEVVDPGDPGPGRVEADVVSAAGGRRVPRITEAPDFAGPSVEIASLALVVALARDAGADLRLAMGLGIEGVLAWYREADARTPPRDALRSAEVHAGERMAEAGRPMPPDLDAPARAGRD